MPEAFLAVNNTLIERKSRVPQIQALQGRSGCKYLRASGSTEDGVLSAFPKGKQDGVVFRQFIFHPFKRYEKPANRLKKHEIWYIIDSPFCLRSFRVIAFPV
jgi:hypothetical protein